MGDLTSLLYGAEFFHVHCWKFYWMNMKQFISIFCMWAFWVVFLAILRNAIMYTHVYMCPDANVYVSLWHIHRIGTTVPCVMHNAKSIVAMFCFHFMKMLKHSNFTFSFVWHSRKKIKIYLGKCSIGRDSCYIKTKVFC